MSARVVTFVFIGICFAMQGSLALGQTNPYQWKPTSGTGEWTDGSKWNPNRSQQSSLDAMLVGTGGSVTVVYSNTNETIYSVNVKYDSVIQQDSGFLTISGAGLYLGGPSDSGYYLFAGTSLAVTNANYNARIQF